ncbi:MAG: pantetheine-phosphate adenylyltransferase [Planctomycetes bacterium]|nr:pantetheine-phosphate adenylyltransferase [Planctomycetota bacterium]
MTTNTEHIVAVYPGSFDPVTHGHLDVIRRAAKLFNELIIGIGRNPGKDMMFTPQERLDMLEPLLAEWPHVRAEAYDGLTFDFVQQCNARVIVRGIRDTTDLSNELLQANLNLMIGQIDTVFLLTRDQHVLTSSTYIKQIYEMGGGGLERIERLVPHNVAEALAQKLRPEKRDA